MATHVIPTSGPERCHRGRYHHAARREHRLTVQRRGLVETGNRSRGSRILITRSVLDDTRSMPNSRCIAGITPPREGQEMTTPIRDSHVSWHQTGRAGTAFHCLSAGASCSDQVKTSRFGRSTHTSCHFCHQRLSAINERASDQPEYTSRHFS